MDDWQDAAFSTRHMHNRMGTNSKSARNNNFDVRKIFGSYSVKCSAWKKIQSAAHGVQSEQPASLEAYRLTENGQGVVCELSLPDCLHAAVILAASRASLRSTITDIKSFGMHETGVDFDNDTIEPGDNGTEEELGQDRFETFEKNSFRSPKFWLQWSGVPTGSTAVSSECCSDPDMETGLGYVVFSGNDCRTFKGTINCTVFGWKNVAITGHKITSRSDRDTIVTWKQKDSHLMAL